jgi:hypothetical protein
VARPRKPETIEAQIAQEETKAETANARLVRLRAKAIAMVHTQKVKIGGAAHEILHLNPDAAGSELLLMAGLYVHLRALRTADDTTEMDRLRDLGAIFWLREHATKRIPHQHGGHRKLRDAIDAALSWRDERMAQGTTIVADDGMGSTTERRAPDRQPGISPSPAPTTTPSAQPGAATSVDGEVGVFRAMPALTVSFPQAPSTETLSYLRAPNTHKSAFIFSPSFSRWFGYGDATLVLCHVAKESGVVSREVLPGSREILANIRTREIA